MKDHIIPVLVSMIITLVISWFLFFPWKKDVYEDGGTIVYSSLTYQLYIWNKIGGKNTVEFYIFPDHRKEISGITPESNKVSQEPESRLGPEHSYTLLLNDNSTVIPQALSTESAIDLSDYDNILDHSSDIIYGEVASIESFNGAGGTAWVKDKVRILESYKGQLSPGTEIIVIQQTGYISAADYIGSFVEEDRKAVRDMIFPNISEEDAATIFLDQTRGIPLDQTGDKIIFCLWVSPQSTEEFTYFEPVGDWAGKQVDTGNDTFAQFYPVEDNMGKTSGENYEIRTINDTKELLKID